MQIEDQGKTYVIEGGKVVLASVTPKKEEVVEKPLALNDTVKQGKRVGKIVGRVSTVYGDSFGVQFTDGTAGSFIGDQLERSNDEALRVAVSDNPAQNLIAEYEKYVELPFDTIDEIESKREAARNLNLRAKALTTDSRVAFSLQTELDSIVTATAVDLMDLENEQEIARAAESADYLAAMPRYKLAAEISDGSLASGEISNLLDEEIEQEFGMSDADIAARATQMVASVERDDLADDAFFNDVKSFAYEYLPNDDDVRGKFDSFAEEARKEKLASPKVAKTAATPTVTLNGESFDLADIPVEALYYSE